MGYIENTIAAIILSLPKSILLFLVAWLLDILFEVGCTFIFYGMLRSCSRGAHANGSIACFFTGMINYLGIAYLSKMISVPNHIYILAFCFCFLIYGLYAPSGTEKRPVGKKQYKRLKAITLLMLAVLFIYGFKINGMLRNIILLTALSQSVTIIPLTYKLLNQKGGVIYEKNDTYHNVFMEGEERSNVSRN